MIEILEKSRCSGCHACYSSCPKHCISMKEDNEGFLYPFIDQNNCINCGVCEKTCPMLSSERQPISIDSYAAQCKDDELLFNSSSGGIFSLLAKKILENDGVVFGAAFTADFKEVHHSYVDSIEDLKMLRTSKYVQSIMGDSYQKAKVFLDAGRKVLFSGVPCQIAGLKNYLKRDYENLTCVDVICHGVPSPELWKRYLVNREEEYQGTISDINFRYKKNGWHDFGIKKTYSEQVIYTSKEADPYMQMFLRNYSLRPSCYSCQSKINGSKADLTLGDFWGIKSVVPEMSDGRGVSAVVINTEKGKQLYMGIIDSIRTKQVMLDDIKKNNSSIYKSVSRPIERDEFFFDMNILSFDELAIKYCKPKKITMKQKIARTKLWKIISQIVRGGG